MMLLLRLLYLILVMLFCCQYSCTGATRIGNYSSTTQSGQEYGKTSYYMNLPCPNAEDIAPCICTYHEDKGDMYLYCANIADEQQLYDIFHANIPVPQFNILSLDTSSVETLGEDVFGDSTFEIVLACKFVGSSGTLKSVDPAAFSKSASTLRELRLFHNELSDFPFDSLTQYSALDYLDLSGNPISSFPIIESQTLTRLNLTNTQLVTIPEGALDGLPNLKRLDTRHTNVDSMTTEHGKTSYYRNWPCPNAEDIAPCICTYRDGFMYLRCDNIADEHQLYDIFHANIPVPQFNTLRLDTSSIETLGEDVFGDSTFERVQTIGSSGTLKYVDPATFIKSTSTLISLNLGYNELSDFPFDSLTQYSALEEFSLNGNPISSFPIIESQTLTWLRLSSTQLVTIPKGALYGLPNLKRLDTRHTNMDSIATEHGKTSYYRNLPCPNDEDIAPCICTYFYGLMEMRCDNIADEQQLYDIFHANIPVPRFTILALDTSSIETLGEDVFGDSTFERVWTIGSPGTLKSVDPAAFSKSASTLIRLVLVNNELSDFPFASLTQYTALDFLNLQSNPISSFPIIESQTLTWLSLGGAHLVTIPEGALDGLPNLKRLFTWPTNVDSMPIGLFAQLGQMDWISMSHMQLGHLESSQFEVNVPYIDIDLQGNNIAYVEMDAFKGVQNGTINLENNQLTILPEETWRPMIDAGVYLKLYGNDLTCGCDVAWLVLEPNYHEFVGDAECQSGELLVELDSSVFEICNVLKY